MSDDATGPPPAEEPAAGTTFESNEARRATEGDAVLTTRGARVEMLSAACFVVAMLAAIALAVVYWEGGQPQAEGILLAVTLGGIGVGIVLWAKHFMPTEEVEEEREPLPSTEEDVAAFTAPRPASRPCAASGCWWPPPAGPARRWVWRCCSPSARWAPAPAGA